MIPYQERAGNEDFCLSGILHWEISGGQSSMMYDKLIIQKFMSLFITAIKEKSDALYSSSNDYLSSGMSVKCF